MKNKRLYLYFLYIRLILIKGINNVTQFKPMSILVMLVAVLFSPSLLASDGVSVDLTSSGIGYTALLIFAIAYCLVMLEDVIHLRKSKPMLIAAGIIWAMIGYYGMHNGMSHEAEAAFRHNLLEYSELFFFLLLR